MKLSRLLTIASRVAAKSYACDEEGCGPVPAHKIQRQDKEINYDKIPPEYLKEKISTDRRGNFKWTTPKLADIDPVISKIAQDLGYSEEYVSSRVSIFIDKDALTSLDDSTWSRLADTDSWRVQTKEEAEFLSSLHDKDRQLRIFLEMMGGGSALAAPIIVVHKGEPRLVDGDTRLMACRILGIQPEVLFVDI